MCTSVALTSLLMLLCHWHESCTVLQVLRVGMAAPGVLLQWGPGGSCLALTCLQVQHAPDDDSFEVMGVVCISA